MAGPGTPGFPAPSGQAPHLIDDLESSFRNCMKNLTSQEHFNAADSDEVKTGVEQNIQKFLDLARQTEAYFLQKRFLIAVKKPEQVVKEDIYELRQELMKKEAILAKYYEKLQHWQGLMRSTPAGQSAPSQTAAGAPHPGQPAPQGAGPNIPHPSPHPQPTAAQGSNQTMMMGGQAHPYSGGPGPLAYLEQTMSNIGMPERR